MSAREESGKNAGRVRLSHRTTCTSGERSPPAQFFVAACLTALLCPLLLPSNASLAAPIVKGVPKGLTSALISNVQPALPLPLPPAVLPRQSLVSHTNLHRVSF